MSVVDFARFSPSLKPGFNELCIDYIHNFMRLPNVWDSFDDSTRRGAAIHSICDEWLRGQLLMGTPMLGDEPIGLFWSRRMNKRMVEGFQSIRPGKTQYSWKAMEAACKAVFEAPEYVDVRYIAGFIETSNRASAFVAGHAGFKKHCVLPGYCIMNGEPKDAFLMIKEK